MEAIRHIFECWDDLIPIIKERQVMLFLDYDGTLTPIVERPELAALPQPMKTLLSELKDLNGLNIAIVSGRSLMELKKLVSIPGLLYVGNHGFEIEGPGINHVHPGALEIKEFMADVAEELRETFESTPGIIVENKLLTLSVHYRLVPEDRIDRVRIAFLKCICRSLDQGQIIFTEGKKVLEVRPALGWNKGTAVTWLYGRQIAADPFARILPVYIGDDSTDEAALKAIKNEGVAVKVMDDALASHANYYLHNPNETYAFLKRIQVLKSKNE